MPISTDEQLGWYRLDDTTLSVEYTLSRPIDRSVGTALRLCALVTTWRRGGLLLHAAGLLNSECGGALLALAASEGGKSTLTDLAEGFASLSDETVAVDWITRPHVSGTTFRSSSTKKPETLTAPLLGLLLLEKCSRASYERVPPDVAARSLFEQAYRLPPAIGGLKPLLQRCGDLAERVPAFRFRFPKNPEAASLLNELIGELDG